VQIGRLATPVKGRKKKKIVNLAAKEFDGVSVDAENDAGRTYRRVNSAERATSARRAETNRRKEVRQALKQKRTVERKNVIANSAHIGQACFTRAENRLHGAA